MQNKATDRVHKAFASMSSVNAQLQILAPYDKTYVPLNARDANVIRRDAKHLLQVRDPLLPCTTDIRIVRDGLYNYINLRVKPQFANVLACTRGDKCAYCFVASDKHEPWVVAVILDELTQARVVIPTLEQLNGLEQAICAFLAKYGLANIDNALFTYTPLSRRCSSMSPHSHHFHVKIYIPMAQFMHMHLITALHVDKIKDLDTIRHCLTKETVSWKVVKQVIADDSQDASNDAVHQALAASEILASRSAEQI